MASKPMRRRGIHTTNLNFRPNTSDANVDTRGTKPTVGPTPIKEIFMIMVLYLCKKSLFFDTNLKVAIYLAALFIISLVADVATIPRLYLSRSDNVFNRFFVKFAWGWNLMLITPYVIFTAYIYCCGQKRRIILHHLSRLAVATFFWYFWTSVFNYVEASIGRCAVKNFSTKEVCLREGHIWNGFDTSGHSFILIYGSLFLIEETRSMINWDSIKDFIRNEEHTRAIKERTLNMNPLKNLSDEEFKDLQVNYEKYTPYIRGLFVIITLFQIMWDVMLVCTMLYYHIMVEKFLGGVVAILTWFVTYRVWYPNNSLLPNLPGDGVFRYIRPAKKEAAPTRRRTGSIVNGDKAPTFVGRPAYTGPNVSQGQPEVETR